MGLVTEMLERHKLTANDVAITLPRMGPGP